MASATPLTDVNRELVAGIRKYQSELIFTVATITSKVSAHGDCQVILTNESKPISDSVASAYPVGPNVDAHIARIERARPVISVPHSLKLAGDNRTLRLHGARPTGL